MRKSHISILTSLLLLAGCGDSAGGENEPMGSGGSASTGGQPSGAGGANLGTGGAASSGGSSPATGGSSTGGTSDTGGSSTGGAGTEPSGCDVSLPAQCETNPEGKWRVCAEHACGRPGDTVDVDIYVQGPANCDNYGNVTVDFRNLQGLTLANPQDPHQQVGAKCSLRRVEVEPRLPPPYPVRWHASPAADACFAGASVPMESGKAETIQFTIPASAAPGDIVLSATGAITGNDEDCRDPAQPTRIIRSELVISPTIRVVAP